MFAQGGGVCSRGVVSAPRGVCLLLGGGVCSQGSVSALGGSALWEAAPGGVSQHALRQTPPPGEAKLGIRSMSGRYASYWNAFMLSMSFLSR